MSILLLAFLIRGGVAVKLPNTSHPDEIFQTQEPAHRLAYGNGVITWEFREGVRSWVFPAFLAGVMRATAWLGDGSSGYVLGLAGVLVLMSLTAVGFGFFWAYRTSGATAAVLAGGACAMWWELVYYAPKALNEVLATHLLLPGLYLGMYGESIRERNRLFLAGLFCGLALALRMSLAPAVMLAAVYLGRQNGKVRLPPWAAGIVVPIILFGLVDAITWSYPFQSFIRHFAVNIVHGKTAEYGVAPWYWYAFSLAKRLGPMLLLALWGIRRSPFLGWMALAILLTHSVVAHKEDRFLYPLLPIVITLAGLGLADVASRLVERLRSPVAATTVIGAGLVVCTFSSIVFAGRSSRWWNGSGTLAAFEALSHERTACAVAFRGIEWEDTGGYTYLHRKIPLLPILQEADVERLAPTFNYIVTSRPLQHEGFELVKSWDGTRLYRRPGPCTPADAKDEVNEVIKRQGG